MLQSAADFPPTSVAAAAAAPVAPAYTAPGEQAVSSCQISSRSPDPHLIWSFKHWVQRNLGGCIDRSFFPIDHGNRL